MVAQRIEGVMYERFYLCNLSPRSVLREHKPSRFRPREVDFISRDGNFEGFRVRHVLPDNPRWEAKQATQGQRKALELWARLECGDDITSRQASILITAYKRGMIAADRISGLSANGRTLLGHMAAAFIESHASLRKALNDADRNGTISNDLTARVNDYCKRTVSYLRGKGAASFDWRVASFWCAPVVLTKDGPISIDEQHLEQISHSGAAMAEPEDHLASHIDDAA